MKTPSLPINKFLICNLLAIASFAGTETLALDLKGSGDTQKSCSNDVFDWTGFYVGLHAGGQFGETKNTDLDNWNGNHVQWGYDENGFVGGGQLGYNFQWRRLVIGPEADLGYLNAQGSGAYPGSIDTIGKSDGDFYTTLRGRIGIALDHNWLIYGTGGAIGLNYNTGVTDDSSAPGPGLIDTSKSGFNWGYVVGGGIEHAINRHWSIKLEYLYFALDKQPSDGVATTGSGGTYRFDTETKGHILRVGVNYRF